MKGNDDMNTKRAIGTYSVEVARKYGINASLLYTEILLFTLNKYEDKSPDDEGYVPITSNEFKELTTLTRRQQDRALKILEENGLIESKLKGIPAKKYFKILKEMSHMRK